MEDILMSNRWSEGTNPCKDRRVFISGGQRGRKGYQLIRRQTAVCLISRNPAGYGTNARDAWQRIKTQPDHTYTQVPTPREVKDKEWRQDTLKQYRGLFSGIEQSFNS